MAEHIEDTIKAWRRRIGAGKEFHEQELWRDRVPQGRKTVVKWCDMDRRLHIKRILIAGLRAGLVECAGAGKWVIN